MIRIEREWLSQVATNYLVRLKEFAKKNPRTTVGKIFKASPNEEEFDQLILCPPEKLQSYPSPTWIGSDKFVTAYRCFFGTEGSDKVNNALWFVQQLNIPVCPYCNRTYMFSVSHRPGKAKRNVRPELDHFFPKKTAKYSHLAISFYNLVPSCPQCNQLKGNTVFDYHPYFGSLKNSGDPSLKVSNAQIDNGEYLFPDNPIIGIENPNENTKTLALQELYAQHTDFVKEIMDKIQAYNADLYEPLISSFQGLSKTPEEIDRLIWGVYIDDEKQIKRPLSKLTIDILKQFDVL